MNTPFLIIGCGYVGRHLAARLPRGQVMALARGEQQAKELASMHIAPVRGDLDDFDSLRRLPPARVVFHLAPPNPDDEQDRRTRRLLAHLAVAAKRPHRIVYVSTTGVYGNRAGDWLDETSAIQPQTARARRRADAEAQLRAFGQRYGAQVSVLRVPGIYGPGRLPLEKLRQGQAVVDYDPPHYSNRIHVDDLVSALLAAAWRGRANRVYQACDGAPSTQAGFLDALAEISGLPKPPHIRPEQAPEQLSALTRSFLEESRRLGNRRLREELGLRLRHADFRDGIRASLTQD
ncbi:NAD-dependent epimerase/dehydratase family protein [Thermithiobacillus plumbiphilus]|uniref:NAD-dependent epimerase/dehydratase family protein n=1 Tax=Thermithiobacillus plumbiphilus TaxID=1729899 RepID=A0ABU9DAM9_9PROT